MRRSKTAPENDHLAPEIGREIKHLRKAKSWTISDLADATGLSTGFLSQIERGLSSPSVKALHTIAQALGVNVSWFFSRPGEATGRDLDVVVRAGQRRTLSFKNGIRDELLSPDLGRQLELLRCVFPPGASSGEKPYSHTGEEAGFIIHGELSLWLGRRKIKLGPGDSFAFSSEQPHRYENPGSTETIVIWAITPPSY